MVTHAGANTLWLDLCTQGRRKVLRPPDDADPALVKGAPHETLVGRIDETRAARQPDLRWRKRSGQ